jgi:hypothetical protein
MARVHAARGLVDVSGTYVGGTTDVLGRCDDDSLLLLDRLEQQISPASFAQFNDVKQAGDMRLRLYNSLNLGARAMGFWRDCFPPHCKSITGFDGPVEKQSWWSDFPNLRREIDRLLPLIRERHWTEWTAQVDKSPAVRVGTRDHKGEAYVILVNQTSQLQQVTVTLGNLPYPATEVRSFFDDQPVATIRDSAFQITLPKIDINSGTMVLRIVSP